MYKKQGTLVNVDERRQLVWKMQDYIGARRPYINLVEESLITASSTKWDGFDPELDAYCKCYYTTPHQVG
jgi:ABC-type transport system substrate-binding protein